MLPRSTPGLFANCQSSRSSPSPPLSVFLQPTHASVDLVFYLSEQKSPRGSKAKVMTVAHSPTCSARLWVDLEIGALLWNLSLFGLRNRLPGPVHCPRGLRCWTVAGTMQCMDRIDSRLGDKGRPEPCGVASVYDSCRLYDQVFGQSILWFRERHQWEMEVATRSCPTHLVWRNHDGQVG